MVISGRPLQKASGSDSNNIFETHVTIPPQARFSFSWKLLGNYCMHVHKVSSSSALQSCEIHLSYLVMMENVSALVLC